jgi:hypothetical protein
MRSRSISSSSEIAGRLFFVCPASRSISLIVKEEARSKKPPDQAGGPKF